MNILYIITKLELGGAQKVCLRLAKGIKKNNNVFIMAGKGGQLNSEAKEIVGKNFIINPYLKREISPFNDLRAYFFIKKFVKNNNIDIVHTHSSKAGVIGRIASKRNGVKKVFHTIHGFPFNDFRNPIVNQLFKNIERYAAKYADKLVAVTKKDIRKGIENNIGKRNQYKLIRAAADIEYFKNYRKNEDKIKDSLDIPRDSFVVVQISCFKKQKNPVDFVKFANKVIRKISDKITFVLIGDGILKKKIRQKIKEFGIGSNFRLTGWQDDIRPYLKIADISTLTSLWEGLPITIIESFLMKTPVLVTNVDGNAEIVENGSNGFLYEPGDLYDAVEKFLILYKNKDLREKMAGIGRRKVIKEFSIKKMINDTKNLYFD